MCPLTGRCAARGRSSEILSCSADDGSLMHPSYQIRICDLHNEGLIVAQVLVSKQSTPLTRGAFIEEPCVVVPHRLGCIRNDFVSTPAHFLERRSLYKFEPQLLWYAHS